MNNIEKFILTLFLITWSWLVVAEITKVYNVDSTPVSEFIWINNNRYHVDSIIDCQPIYNEAEQQIGSWIRISYKETTVFVECVDTVSYDWMEYRDSFLDNFRGLR